MDTAYGMVLTGVAIPTVYYQANDSSYNGWDCANSLVPQLDRLFRMLITDPDPATVAILLAADVVLGLASTVTQIGDALSS